MKRHILLEIVHRLQAVGHVANFSSKTLIDLGMDVKRIARMGITAPDRVSLACMDQSSNFDWSRPKITHIAWKESAVDNSVIN